MPIAPSALLNLWSLEELPACDEGMEHARAFLTSAGEAVSNIENHDPRLLLREFVVLFRIFAAHSATCPKCNQVSVADSNVAMPRMTAELFREILDSIEGDIETLEIEKTVSEGEDVPTQAERSAIERVQSTLKQSKSSHRSRVGDEGVAMFITDDKLPDDVVRRQYAKTKHALCCLNCGFEHGFDPTQPGSIGKPLWVLLEHECRSAES